MDIPTRYQIPHVSLTNTQHTNKEYVFLCNIIYTIMYSLVADLFPSLYLKTVCPG